MTTQGRKIQSIETAFDIVEYIRESNSCTVTEIANGLNRSKSTVHAHLLTLEDRGYLICDKNEYRLGLSFLTLGGAAQNDQRYQDLYRAMKPEINDLADQTGERAQAVVEYRAEGIYFFQASGNRSVIADTYIGARVSLHSTAVGKTILANLPDERVQSILDEQQLAARTPNTIVDPAKLLSQLETIRDQGYAFDREERVEGICCVAAPIDCGNIAAGVSVTVPRKRANGEYFENELPELVKNVARVIELNTQYS